MRDAPDEEPRPERRVELRRAVHLEPEPRAPPAVGERRVELRRAPVVRHPARRASPDRRTRGDARSATSRPRGCSRRASRSARSGTRTGRPRPRSARAARGLRRRPSRRRWPPPRAPSPARTPRARRRAAGTAPPRARRATCRAYVPGWARTRLTPDSPEDARSPSPSPTRRSERLIRSSWSRGLPREKNVSRSIPYDRYGSCVSSVASRPPARAARGGAVVGLDDVIHDERAEEREVRLRAPRDGEVVVPPRGSSTAHAAEQRDGDARERGRPREPDRHGPARSERQRAPRRGTPG